jgi:biopolymer transport protein ExbB/TolQ
MPGVCPNAWQTYGCESSIGYLWRWTSLLERVDLIVLALMLAHVVVVVARVSYRYRSARHPGPADTSSEAFQRARRKLAAELSIGLGGLKSIAFTAPYLGLAGTCVGILNIFRGYGMEKHAALAMMASQTAAALVTTATGILVAVPATCLYNCLRTRIDVLESEVANDAIGQGSHYFQVARRFALRRRFSQFPFAVIAGPVLAISGLAGFMTFSSFHTPKGLPVRLVRIGVLATDRLSVEPIVIEIMGRSANDPLAVYAQSEKTPSDELEGRLRRELGLRPRWLAYVQAEDSAPWGDVVNVIDVVEGLHANVVLLTITPHKRCPQDE